MDDIRDLMLRSLDEELDHQQQETLKRELSNSKELSQEYDKYLEIRKILSETNYGFNNDFSQNVINSLMGKRLDLYNSFKMFAVSSAAAIAILFLSVYLMDGSINIDAIIGLDAYSVEDEFYSFLIN